jgi:prolyl oligopeptidase
MSQFVYPDTRRDDTVFDTYGTEKVADPYQWLEDPDSEETQAWVAGQNKVTDAFLGSIPIRNKIKERMTELYNYPKYGCPFKRGDKYYFFKNDGLQNQDVLYRQNTLTAEPELFFDPNKLSEDGTVSLSRLSFSESGDYFAYMISKSGSDWNTIKIKPTRDGTELNADQLGESLEWVKFSGLSWTHDNKGFFYSRYPQPASLKGGTNTRLTAVTDTCLTRSCNRIRRG